MAKGITILAAHVLVVVYSHSGVVAIGVHDSELDLTIDMHVGRSSTAASASCGVGGPFCAVQDEWYVVVVAPAAVFVDETDSLDEFAPGHIGHLLSGQGQGFH